MIAGSQAAAEFRVGYLEYHRLPDLNFQLNRFTAFTAGELDVAGVREVAARISDYRSWVAELSAFGDRLEGEGRLRAAAGMLRAADFFVSPNDPQRPALRKRFIELAQAVSGIEPDQREWVAYEGSALPAYRLAPASPQATVVVFGGFDSYVEEWFAVMRYAVDRGIEVIAFDGPGQGSALEERGIKMTPEWHRPVSAVFDHFGLENAAIIGISLGGCLAIRAAAHEPRVSAVACDDVMTDLRACMLAQAPPARRRAMRVARFAPDAAVDAIASRIARRDLMMQWGIRQAEHVFGVTGTSAVLREAGRYNTRDVSHRVTQDVLVLAGANDHYVPLEQLPEQVGLLTDAASVTARVLTAADDAGDHCHVGNVGLSLDAMFSWFEELRERPRHQTDLDRAR
jgi:pimeloyl-ACP methyl ester carboxylesterase